MADVLSRNGCWVPARFASYGRQRLYRIRLTRNGVGKAIFATSGHRWFIHDRRSEALTTDLRAGHYLETATPEIRREWHLDPDGVRHGIVFGDGTAYCGGYGTINLHGEKDAELARWFPGQTHHAKQRAGSKPYVRIYGGRAFSHMKELPAHDADESYLLGFLAGYLAADGHVAKDGTVSLNSAKAEYLEAVRDVATSLGITTYGLTTQMRRGFGASNSAICRIHFVPATMHSALFLLPEARRRFENHGKKYARLRWRVVDVTETDRDEEVFCAEVPDGNAFTLDDNILTGNCFGCQAHGDAIRWLTDAKGMAFMDAVKELADAAGMAVPAPDPRAQAKAERQSGLYEVMEAAQAWFVNQLNGIEGAAARDYLKTRGVDAATRERFGFGFAPDSRGKLKAALDRFGKEKLVESGLLIQPDAEEGKAEREPYDRFRGRLTFPIRDPRGRVIAFSARILGAGEPKYLNSPDTPLFDKGRTLFNFDQAAPASRTAKRVIVVEGQMDAIALAQAGIGEAVAPLGTAVTEAQLGLLWRLSPTPIFCFDGDSAGQKAAVRAALRALPGVSPGRSLNFVTLPAGQDPDDLIRSRGREALEALLESPEPLVDRLWRHEREAEPLATPEQRAGLRRRLLDHVAVIADPDTRDQYRAALLDRFAALAGPQRSPGFASRRPWAPQRPLSPEAKAVGRSGIDGELARAVLSGLVRFPDLIADHVEAIDHLPLPDRNAARLRDLLVESALTHATLDNSALDAILARQGAAAQAEAARSTRGLAFSFTRRDAEPERARRDLVLAIEALAARPGIEAALAAATARAKMGDDQGALDEQRDLLMARHEADRKLATLFESGAD
jgi:DNA primase